MTEESLADYVTRLEQDSKQLTQWLDEARRNAEFWCDKCTSLEQENKELKEKVEVLDKMTGIFSARLCDKYRSALEEIREMFLNQVAWVGQLTNFEEEIYNKINEVLNA